jgi:nitrite reductase/ring-hydroxylating ferredoxin subunit
VSDHSDDNPAQFICDLTELSNLDCREFTFADGERQAAGFVVNRAEKTVAYRNECPHTGAPLNWQENQFLDLSRTEIQCTLHGARFRIADGICVHGPCLGQALKKIDTFKVINRLYAAGPKPITDQDKGPVRGKGP